MSSKPWSGLKQKITLWTGLKKVRATRLSKYYSSLVVVVPLAAASNQLLFTRYGIVVPSPTNSVILYFSALSFFLGSALFDIKCPAAIRDYDSRFRFVEDWVVHAERMTASLDKIEGKINDTLQKIVAKIETVKAPDPEKALEGALLEAHQSLQTQLLLKEGFESLDAIWSDENECAPIGRVLVQALYAISAALAGYITFYDAPLRVLSSLSQGG